MPPSIRPGGQRSCGLPGGCQPRELPAAALLPGHSCPFLREETKVPFCRVGRATAVATSDRAAGQSPTPLPSRSLSPAALGVPCSAASPAQGSGAVPALCWLHATKPRGMPLPKKRDGAGERDRHCSSQIYTRTCILVGRERGWCPGGRAPSTIHPAPASPAPGPQPRGVT